MGARIQASWIPSAVSKYADSLSRAWGPKDLKAIEKRAHEDNMKPCCDANGSMIKDMNASALTPSDMPDARDQPMPQHGADPSAALQRKLPGRPHKARRVAFKDASTFFALDLHKIDTSNDRKHPAIVKTKRAEDKSKESRERCAQSMQR